MLYICARELVKHTAPMLFAHANQRTGVPVDFAFGIFPLCGALPMCQASLFDYVRQKLPGEFKNEIPSFLPQCPEHASVGAAR